MAGINRALPLVGTEAEAFKLKSMFESADQNKPCIFLSHISVDKEVVETIAEYIMEKADIDVYLDIYDEDLQRAVEGGDSIKITELIEKGISKSSHAMCLISEETINSWWVPYELGYAKSSGKKISSLKLNRSIDLPDFLKIGELIHGIKSLNEYIKNVISDFEINESYSKLDVSLESFYQEKHSLCDILYWGE